MTALIKPLKKEKLIEDNPMVDSETLTQYEKVEMELRRLGVNTGSKFKIKPPLGEGEQFRPDKCVHLV